MTGTYSKILVLGSIIKIGNSQLFKGINKIAFDVVLGTVGLASEITFGNDFLLQHMDTS